MKKTLISILICLLFCYCSSNKPSKQTNSEHTVTQTTEPINQNEENRSTVTIQSESNDVESDNSDGNDDNTESNEESSKLSDGMHEATVEYNNPETGYSATYTLQVQVEDKQVVEIDFPKGGWLDSDHITPADLEDDGTAHVEGEDGKTYDVTIDD